MNTKRSSPPPAIRPYHHGDLHRALVQAALDIVTEEQEWGFSLRHVARRAGVSHNAPYNHFADKDELLAEVAAAGMVRLADNMQAAIAGTDVPAEQLLQGGLAYVRTGTANPALYRLIFGPVLADAGKRAQLSDAAGARARGILEDIIERGARTGAFAIAADDVAGQAAAVIAAWSVVHGLTTLIIDGVANPNVPAEELVNDLTGILLNGLLKR